MWGYSMSVEDEFIGKAFGEYNQVKVIGWLGELAGSNKKYTVECSVCKSDPELFGSGKFLITKNKLLIGRLPCGCSLSPRWSKEQYEIKIKRLCKEDSFKFLGWDGDYKGRYTRILLSCPKHGDLEPKSLNDFLGGRRCIECRRDLVKEGLTKDDTQIIEEFFATGAFHPSSKFSRSDRKVPAKRYREGSKPYWNFTCGGCQEEHETLYSTLKNGGASCGCFRHKQKLAYIHLVYDGASLVALKFGITSKTNGSRLKQQNKSSVLNLKPYGVWEFPSISICKQAERQVKQSLRTSVVEKELMRDGWTETCYPLQLDEIIKIYEDLGGVRTIL